MSWFVLFMAGILEALGVLTMNKVKQHPKFGNYLLLVLAFGGSLIGLGIALQRLPMGTAYAIWTGIGTIGGAIFGIIFYQESKSYQRLFFISLIFIAVIGIKIIG